MLYQVTLGERTFRVQLRRQGERTFVRVDDGDERPVELSALRGALHSLLLGAQRTELLARRSDDRVEVSLAGLSYHAEVMDEAHARVAQVAAARGGVHVRRDLKAPMPGLVVKVLVAPGEEVVAGQPLVVLQAMKMENELSVARPGTVNSIQVAEGQTVEAGQVLASID